jgi:hypothetical protein
MSDLSAYYEELQGRLRALLITIENELPRVTVDLVAEMIDANELGVALQIMSEMLVESRGSVTEETLDTFGELARVMQLDAINVERLRPLLSPNQ